MNSELRHHRYGRALGAGVLSVALLSGGTTGAFAAPSAPTPTPTTTPSPTTTRTGMPNVTRTPTARPSLTRTPTARPSLTRTPTARPSVTRTGRPTMKPSRMPTVMGSITVAANRTAIKVGDTVVFTGRATGVRRGSTLVLQHLVNGKWATLNYRTVVGNNGRYTIKRTFTAKGTHHVRVATRSGTFHSSPVTVTVS